MVWSAPAEMAKSTVATNVVVAMSPFSSVTVTVMFEEPVCPGAATSVMVRLAPAPPNVMPEDGNNDVFAETAVRMRLLGLVSASPTVMFNGPNVPQPVWAEILEIVGGVCACPWKLTPIIKKTDHKKVKKVVL